MSKLLLSSILASGLLLAGGSAHAGDADHNKEAKAAQTEQQMNQETDAVNDTKATTESMSDAATDGNYAGEVVGIEGDTVQVKDKEGTEHTVQITGFEDLQELQAESLEKGDKVVVLTRDGKPYAISKVAEAWMPDVDLADTESIRGKVVEVDGDTIQVKDENGIVHNVDITGFQDLEELQAETIEEGDLVVINVRDGKTYGVSKTVEAWLVD